MMWEFAMAHPVEAVVMVFFISCAFEQAFSSWRK